MTERGRSHRSSSRAYTYRADGHLTGVDDQLSGARRFDLDAAGRVTAVHAADWTETLRLRRGGQPDARRPGRPPTPATRPPAPRTYTGTRITRAGDVRYEHDAAGPHHPAPEDPPVPQAGHLALRVGRRGPPHVRSSPRTARVWRYRYDPLGRRTAKQRLAADGETVGRASRLHLGRHDPVRTDHHGRRPARTRSPSPGTTRACDPSPRPNASSGRRLPGGDRLPLLRHRHRPRRHPDRTRRRTGEHRLAHPHHPVGHHRLDRRQHRRTPPCASPASTSTRKPASTTTTSATTTPKPPATSPPTPSASPPPPTPPPTSTTPTPGPTPWGSHRTSAHSPSSKHRGETRGRPRSCTDIVQTTSPGTRTVLITSTPTGGSTSRKSAP